MKIIVINIVEKGYNGLNVEVIEAAVNEALLLAGYSDRDIIGINRYHDFVHIYIKENYGGK